MLLKIKELRKSKKLSQQHVADLIGISVRMFADYESEISDIPLRKLQNIADALQVPLFSLFNTEGNFETINEPDTKYGQVPKNSEKDSLIAELQKANGDLRLTVADLRRDKDLLLKQIDVLGKRSAS